MGIRYDPAELSAELAKRPGDVAARAVFVATKVTEWIAGVLRDAATGQLEKNETKRAAELVATFAALGPSFVKIGQALSSRPDLVNKTYLEALGSLQDNLPSFSTDVARAVICEELDLNDIGEAFFWLSDEPVAAASLGQVYRGFLVNPDDPTVAGREVAVKVQRPGIGETIAVDMLLLRRDRVSAARSVPAAGPFSR
jgi:predicted unusual protein kinase regulating ubiquinone biosynthesis (AarF/ABC1/UbiB family)